MFEFVAVEDETGATWVLVVGGALAASCARSMAMVSASEVFDLYVHAWFYLRKLELGLVASKIFFLERYLC